MLLSELFVTDACCLIFFLRLTESYQLTDSMEQSPH